MKVLRVFAVVFCVAGSAIIARAQFTGTYAFGTAATDVPSVTNVSFGALTATNVSLTYSSGNGNVTINSWATNGVAADTTEYLSLTVQPNTGYTLDLTQLTLKESRSSTGPANISIALLLNGVLQETSSTFATTNTTTTTSSAMTTRTFDFANLTSITATSVVQFRIYGWGGTGSTGNLRLDDIAISGSVSAVPEPSTYAAMAGVLALAAVAVQRRRQKNAKPA